MRAAAPSPGEIKALRRRARMSQADVAQLLGVTRMTIYNYEHGRTTMRPSMFGYMTVVCRER